MDRRSLPNAVSRFFVLIAVASLCAGSVAADYVLFDPIAIRSDEEFTAENGVLEGSGTVEDPYIISGLEIDAGAAPYGILVEGTSAVFQIADCRVLDAVSAAIRLIAVQSASVTACRIEGADTAIQLLEVDGSLVERNEILDCSHAILLQLASSNVIASNRASGGLLGLGLESWSEENVIRDNVFDCTVALAIANDCNNNVLYRNDFLSSWLNCDASARWASDEDEGNFWISYRGQDLDGDGFGDSPFPIPGIAHQRDPRPAIAPYDDSAESDS